MNIDRVKDWIKDIFRRDKSPLLISSRDLTDHSTLSVPIGVVSGTIDARRTVEFRGELLAQHHCNAQVTETLYRAFDESSDGRLVVHTRILYKVPGLTTECALHSVEESDISLNGRYTALYHQWHPLTIEEALT